MGRSAWAAGYHRHAAISLLIRRTALLPTLTTFATLRIPWPAPRWRQMRRPDERSSRTALNERDVYCIGVLTVSTEPAYRPLRSERRGGTDRRRHGQPEISVGHQITRNNPTSRPLSAFDDEYKVTIEMPRGLAQGEPLPLFAIGPVASRFTATTPRIDHLNPAAHEIRHIPGGEVRAT